MDHHRSLRQGFPEVVLCEGKTKTRFVPLQSALEAPCPFLATRASREVAPLLNARRRFGSTRRPDCRAPRSCARLQGLVLCDGRDLDIRGRRARVTAEVMGSRVETLYDVGVAGSIAPGAPGRLMEARVVVVAPGWMECCPALRGLVECPVVAVPTIAATRELRGVAALLTMLNSCAAGVGVMNIDNGFGAGCLADRINLLGEKP